MQAESMARKRKPSNKIQIRNVPSSVSCDTVKGVVESLIPGVAQKFEEAGAEGSVYVTFDTIETAQEAISSLDGYQLEGAKLQVDFASKLRKRSNGNSSANASRQDFPLRIVVGSEYVGAIIGKSGQTIKNITQQSKARVDIHREDNIYPETVVTIRGTSEACTKACQEIMGVVQAEAQSLGRGDCPLRILCPNSLCGRIIGKKGNIIKSFMEKSKTNIVVSSFEAAPYPSNMSDMNSYYVDRVITVTGKLEDSIKAEEMISEKMKQCYDQDIHSYQQQQMMFGGLPTLPMMPGGMNSYPAARPPYPYMQQQGGSSSYYGRAMYNGGLSLPPPPQQLEVIFLYIPEQSVGAVIGSKGQNIKTIMQISGARIKIMGADVKNGGSSHKSGAQGQQSPDDRKVIITGSPEAQWKAQFYIFEKVKTEMMLTAQDEVHLRSEISVPKSSIGRIIGKGGQNVKEMQRVSGAIVQVPEDQGEDDEVPVTIIGHFYACQSAQRRVRALMNMKGQGLLPLNPRGPPRPLQMNGN